MIFLNFIYLSWICFGKNGRTKGKPSTLPTQHIFSKEVAVKHTAKNDFLISTICFLMNCLVLLMHCCIGTTAQGPHLRNVQLRQGFGLVRRSFCDCCKPSRVSLPRQVEEVDISCLENTNMIISLTLFPKKVLFFRNQVITW